MKFGRLKRYIFATFVIFQFLNCAPSVLHQDSLGENIICFGNSITAGTGALPGEDFPSLLEDILNLPVINAGQGGETTRDALKRLREDVLEKNPRLVIVEFGGNDYLQKIPKEETFKNLETIVEAIQERKAMVALAAVRIGVLTDEYYSEFKRIATKHKALLIPDIMKEVFTNPKFKSDGLHPNAQGYRLIAQRIYRYIVPLLK